MKHELIARRSLLKSAVAGAIAVPVAALCGRVNAAAKPAAAAAPAAPATPAAPAAGAALVPLKMDDPTAKALGYVEDSTKVDLKTNPTHKPEQNCAACVQFKGKATDVRAGCNIYPGKTVSSHGWCKVWAQKPKT